MTVRPLDINSLMDRATRLDPDSYGEPPARGNTVTYNVSPEHDRRVLEQEIREASVLAEELVTYELDLQQGETLSRTAQSRLNQLRLQVPVEVREAELYAERSRYVDLFQVENGLLYAVLNEGEEPPPLIANVVISNSSGQRR